MTEEEARKRYAELAQKYEDKAKQINPIDLDWAAEEVARLQKRLDKLEKFVNDLNLQVARMK